MKNYLSILAILILTTIGTQAQSTNLTLVSTNETVEFNKVDVTVSSAGSSYGGVNQAGVDFSVSINPLEQLPQVWFGISQSLYWEPTFGGSTDIDVDWNFDITDKICILAGWSIGDVYGAGIDNLVRTGPELIAQYYLSDDAYVYGAVNYDLLTQQSGQGWQSSNDENNGWCWSIGIGVEF